MKNPIFQLENWTEIGATLARNKTRTFLTAFGIFWGTAMLAMLWGGAAGLEGMLMRQFAGFATNLGGVGAGRTTISYKGYNKGMYWSLNDRDVENIKRITPHLEYTSPMCFNYGPVAYNRKSSRAQSMGVEADYFRIMQPVLKSGRLINESDVAASRKVLVMGSVLAQELFGSEPAVGKYVSVGGVYFKVVGVAAQKSEASIGGRLDNSVVMPVTTLRRAFTHSDDVNFMVFTVEPGHTATELKPYIKRAVYANHPISPDDDQAMWIMDISEQFKMVETLFMAISLLALFVGMGSLMAGIIGVGNIMWIIVKERTGEIGIRRAIGARRSDIIVQILSESMLLTAVAGTAGVCFAAIVLGVTDHMTYDPVLGSAHFELSFKAALAIMATFIALGTAAGTLPALKAMRIKPVEAMRDR